MIVAAAPSDKKIFSDEFLDTLRNEIIGKVPVKDPHFPSTVSPCMSFQLFSLLDFFFLMNCCSIESHRIKLGIKNQETYWH